MELMSTNYRHAMENFTEMQIQQEKYAAKLSYKKENILECENALIVNFMLTGLVDDLQKEIETLANKVDSFHSTVDEKNLVEFCFQTVDGGRQYYPAVQSLYYTLLADQIPPAKVSRIIKAVLKCFIPSINVDDLRLPSEGCAGYMRRQELSTVSMAHKATLVAKQATQIGMIHLNSDGTTKSQKKINGLALNGLTISVNEVADGSADRIVEDISIELKKLRDMANTYFEYTKR